MVLIQRMGVTLAPKCLLTLQEPSAAMICSLRWRTGAGWSWPSISGRGGAEEVGERRMNLDNNIIRNSNDSRYNIIKY